jgi:hypothetical protein
MVDVVSSLQSAVGALAQRHATSRASAASRDLTQMLVEMEVQITVKRFCNHYIMPT